MAYQRREYFQPAGVNTGGAQVFASLGDKLRAFTEEARGKVDATTIQNAKAAGAEAARGGDTKLKSEWNKANAAYNDGLVRAYALDVYADVQQNMTRLELESGNDPEKFKAAADGYRKGLMSQVIGPARGVIEEQFTERFADGLARIQTAKAKDDHLNAQAQADRGRKAMSDDISRLMTSTDLSAQERGLKLLDTYNQSVDADVASGLLTLREGQKIKDDVITNANKQVVISQFEATLERGGNPTAVIQDFMKTGSPLMSDSEKVQFVGSLLERLNLHQAMESEKAQTDNARLKAQYQQGEKQATELLLQGRLTMPTIEKMVEDDQLDPGVARSLRNELKAGGARIDDDAEAFKVASSLLDYTEDEIAKNPRLSWDTRLKMLEKRRSMVGGWQDTNEVQEARRRIDAELGIVPGTQQNLSDEAGRRRGRAQTELYNRLKALPDAERRAKAIETAEAVIQQTMRDKATVDLQRTRDRLARRRKELETISGGNARKVAEDDIARLEAQVKKLEAKQ